MGGNLLGRGSRTTPRIINTPASSVFTMCYV